MVQVSDVQYIFNEGQKDTLYLSFKVEGVYVTANMDRLGSFSMTKDGKALTPSAKANFSLLFSEYGGLYNFIYENPELIKQANEELLHRARISARDILIRSAQFLRNTERVGEMSRVDINSCYRLLRVAIPADLICSIYGGNDGSLDETQSS